MSEKSIRSELHSTDLAYTVVQRALFRRLPEQCRSLTFMLVLARSPLFQGILP